MLRPQWARPFRVTAILAAAAVALAAAARPSGATGIQELVRLKGQGETVLQGFGLVTGLPGTGDSGKDLVVARPLAQLLQSQGNPVGNLEELAKAKSVAIVTVTCTIGRDGARQDDTVDVFVTALNNPKGLEGGRLFLTPLRGPLPGQGVFAIAEGPLVIEGLNTRAARVRGGARLVRDIDMRTIAPDGTITLVIQPHAAGWTTAQLLASVINDHRQGLEQRAGAEIAYAADERTVRVRIPEAELPDPANFIADILSIRFDPSLLALPAKVVVNERTGVIVVTGEVQISPVILAHNDLVITTVTPPPTPTPDNPLVARDKWTAIDTTNRQSDTAKLEDLLRAFKQLDVPVREQIAILSELYATGRLHAQLVVD